jgi:hypothetical protein
VDLIEDPVIAFHVRILILHPPLPVCAAGGVIVQPTIGIMGGHDDTSLKVRLFRDTHPKVPDVTLSDLTLAEIGKGPAGPGEAGPHKLAEQSEILW